MTETVLNETAATARQDGAPAARAREAFARLQTAGRDAATGLRGHAGDANGTGAAPGAGVNPLVLVGGAFAVGLLLGRLVSRRGRGRTRS